MNRFLFFRFFLPLLLVCGAAGGWFWFGTGGMQVDSSADRLLASDPRNLETYQKLEELLPDTEMVLVALRMDEIFSNRGAHIIARTSQLLYRVPGCSEVKSLTHSGRPIRSGFRLEIEPFIPLQATPEEWEDIASFTTGFPLSRNVLVSEDARYAILVAVYTRDLPDLESKKTFQQEVLGALAEAEQVVEAVHVLSFPFLEVEGVAAVEQDLRRYLLWAGGLILVVLALTFRSPVMVLTVLLWEALGMGLLVLSFQLLEHPVDVYTGILFPLIGGLQLTYVIHYLSAFQREVRTVSPPDAARRAIREVLAPSALAALTTVAGLATLSFSGLPTLQGFGRIGMLAVGLVFAGTFFLPLCMGFRRPQPVEGDGAARSGFRFRRRISWGVVMVMLAGILGWLPQIRHIRTDIRAVEFIKPGHPVRESIEVLNRDLGGTNIFQLEVDTGTPKGLQTLPVLQFLEELREVAMSLDGVTDAYAYSQLYMGLNQIWQGGDRTTATLPTTTTTLALFSQLLNATPLLFEDSFVNRDASSSLMIVRSKDLPAREYLALLETLMEEARRRAPEGITLKPVNGLHTLLEGDRQVVRAQTETLAWSIGLVGILLAVLWRSLRLAGVVLIANIPALVTIFGGMGLTGYPLNSITVMVAAVILGIAVDDGIHLVGAFRRFCKLGADPETAAGHALLTKWKPMACTSAILAVFLGLLVLTSFLPVAHFGILGALGIAAAWVGAVLFLPGLLSLTAKRSCAPAS